MSGIIRNSLRLGRTTKNFTSQITFQRPMANRSCGSTKNLIALSEAHPFCNYLCKRLLHTLANSSNEATKIKTPEYNPKVDETFKNFAQKKPQQMKNNKIFASIIDKDDEIIETKKRPEILICDGIKYSFCTEPLMRYTPNRIVAQNEIPNVKEDLIRTIERLFCRSVSSVIMLYIMQNFSLFSEDVYTENGLKLVLDLFSCISQVN